MEQQLLCLCPKCMLASTKPQLQTTELQRTTLHSMCLTISSLDGWMLTGVALSSCALTRPILGTAAWPAGLAPHDTGLMQQLDTVAGLKAAARSRESSMFTAMVSSLFYKKRPHA